MVGVWEGLNLGSIPNDHMPSQKDPKISIERRYSTILPFFPLSISIQNFQGSMNNAGGTFDPKTHVTSYL